MSKKSYTLRSDLEKARASALASLCMREHSVYELENKLNRKGYEQESIEIVIQECLSDNYLNDKRFAEIYWRSRARKGFGPIKISMELKSRGVDSDISVKASEQDELDFYETIKTAYDKKYRGKAIQDFKEKLKRQNYLYQRGFDSSLISSINDLSR